jgi:tetratricopeptide (TPR) repeat protein
VRPEIDRLHELERQLRAAGNEYWALQVRIQGMEAEAWLAQAEGRPDDAERLLRSAADEEDAIEKLPVTPGPIIPAREQLGDLLLEQHRPDQAVKEFRNALASAPNRRGSLDGLSRATGQSRRM